MKLLPKAGLVVVAIMFTLFSLSVQAEKKKVTWTTKWGKPQVAMMSPSVFNKDHILVQWERRDKVTSPDPEWNGIEAVYYEQADEVAGSAVVTGYAVLVFKNGDKAFHRLDGAYTGTYKDNGAWEGTAEGLYRFIGGTGKYKNIKGTAVVHCKGVDINKCLRSRQIPVAARWKEKSNISNVGRAPPASIGRHQQRRV